MHAVSACDPFLSRFARLEREVEGLDREIALLRQAMQVTRRLREQGLPVSEILALSPGPARHESVASRTDRLGEALRDYRTTIVRCLVDEEGWTLTRVADQLGCARQVASRLYHAWDEPRRGTRPRPKIRLSGSPRGLRAGEASSTVRA